MTEEEIETIKTVLLRWFDQNQIEADECSQEIAAALDKHREGKVPDERIPPITTMFAPGPAMKAQMALAASPMKEEGKP